ncbi:MAG: aminotransferase class IV [Desulfobacterales bacterium]|nr:aminotransferase class IV [Desulfobacterales bacterium]
MPELASVNGNIFPIEQAMVPVEDRGYQFGDAVYEVMASYNGQLFFLEAHLDRLAHSMQALSFPDLPKDKIKAAATGFFKSAGLDRALLYIQISRGVGPRTHAFTDTSALQFIMTVRHVKEVPEKLRRQGASAITLQDFRWGRCDIKTVQLLPNVLAKQKAMEAGVYDAIFVSKKNVIRETTGASLFMVTGGKVVTHPLTFHVLPGITRAKILTICRKLNIVTEETFFTARQLYAATEVFLTGTTIEVLPVVRINNRPIGNGETGPVAQRLHGALREHIFQQAK